MSYLLDTCAIPELWKPVPNEGLLGFLADLPEDALHLSALSLGEIKKGIGRLQASAKRTHLDRAYARLRARFGGRILPVTAQVGARWGELDGDATRRGLHLHVVDGLLAATALVGGLTLVTRNTNDFG